MKKVLFSFPQCCKRISEIRSRKARLKYKNCQVVSSSEVSLNVGEQSAIPPLCYDIDDCDILLLPGDFATSMRCIEELEYATKIGKAVIFDKEL